MDYTREYMTLCRVADGEKLPENHRSKIILHYGGQWYLAEFASVEQLRDFAEAVGGFEWTLDHVQRLEHERVGDAWKQRKPYTVEYYTLSHRFDVDAKCHRSEWGTFPGFWSLDELPEGARPFVGLSNGSLVKCYATNDGETVRLFRPNPNAKAVYKPLAISGHVEYIRRHGDAGPLAEFAEKFN